MRYNYARPLDTNQVVEDFLNFALQLDYKKDVLLKKIVTKIVDSELGVSKFSEESQTINIKEMRDEGFRNEQDRWKLRKQIINELLTKKRLDDDAKISLGKGGALPNCNIKAEKQAFILTGLPASGKSTIANLIAEDFGAVIIDSDFAKRKLPEFNNHLYGASIVHEESSQITFGFKIDNPKKVKSLYEECIEKSYSIVIPRIGQNPAKIHQLTVALKESGYEVHLILVYLPRRDATIRAVYRYAKTKRYVPLGLIFDEYGNDPSHSYYYLRCKHEKLFKSLGAISTKTDVATCIDSFGESPALKYPVVESILSI